MNPLIVMEKKLKKAAFIKLSHVTFEIFYDCACSLCQRLDLRVLQIYVKGNLSKNHGLNVSHAKRQHASLILELWVGQWFEFRACWEA